MTFRTRVSLALAAVALAPLLLLGLGIRREMSSRLADQATARVQVLTNAIEADLATDRAAIRVRLRAIAGELAGNTRFRLAIGGDEAERRWLLDWAGIAMRLASLDMLELLDSTGRIISSGHFRNDFDRVEPDLLEAIRRSPNRVALVRLPLAEGALSAMVLADSVAVSGRSFTLVGGRVLDSARVVGLSRGSEVAVQLLIGDTKPSLGALPVVAMPFIDRTGGGGNRLARIVAVPDPDFARGLVAGVDRWVAIAMAASALLAGVGAWWLGRMVALPVADLARQTEGIDLDRLHPVLPTDRTDEIGALARVLERLTARIRVSANRLRESERRATIGDLARQVNHDIKNGLAPIRHVLRHLSQTADQDPAQLGPVFNDRRSTLDSSVDYLDRLARNYARLSPSLAATSSSLNQVVAEQAKAVAPSGTAIETELDAGAPQVRADPVVLRRIVDNLVSNAIDTVTGRSGRIRLTTRAIPGSRVALVVADNGAGIAPEHLERVFEDFYTTKPDGTGLGLSVVRRLVADLGGSIRVESELGKGTVFTVELPSG